VLAGIVREHFDLPALALGVPRVHAEQVTREDRRFVAARAGADLEENIRFIARIARDQQLRELDVLEIQSRLQVTHLVGRKVAHVGICARCHLLRSGQFALEFSRGGWANPGGFPRGNVLRVAYNFEDDKLVRYHWPVMDRTTATPPVRTELLDGVSDIEVRYLDGSNMWQLDWPPVGMAGAQRLIERPRAVEFAIVLKDFGRVSRLVETTG